MQVARASPRHTDGIEPDEPRYRAGCETVRSTNPAPAAGCGRKSCDASSRKFRSTFFCAPSEGNDPHLRVTEATVDDSSGTKARECMCVRQVAPLGCFGHRQIMPDFSSPQTCINPYENRPHSLINALFLPTLKPEEPLFIESSVRGANTQRAAHQSAIFASGGDRRQGFMSTSSSLVIGRFEPHARSR